MSRDSASDVLLVKNPHSILAALKARPGDVLEITLPREVSDDVWKQIQAVGERSRVRIQTGGGGESDSRGGGDRGRAEPRGGRERDGGPHRSRDPRRGGKRGGREGGMDRGKPGAGFLGRESSHGALIKPKAPLSIEEVIREVSDESRGVWLALDQIQDPQNLGAIFRTASFFGVKGIILTTERSAPMTATVYDISAGGVETVPFAPVINLQRAFEKAKESGLWLLGTSEHAKTSLGEIKKDRPWLLVMGNEENGLRRLTLEACDMTVGIQPRGEGVTSLNVSVATGVMLSHLNF